MGDEIIASGLARGAAARGVRVAFGTGRKIVWSWQSKEIFKNNPNVAAPGEEENKNIEWIGHYRGNRLYGRVRNGRWVFNEDFVCPRGEIFFSGEEEAFGLKNSQVGRPMVVVEPRVKPLGACAGINKQWPLERYAAVADCLTSRGFRVVQFVPEGSKKLLLGVEVIKTPTFRGALAVLKNAALYVGPEGGLHHGAAALGVPAVVIFGGFNSPKATGYKTHTNISIGEPCGAIIECEHCKKIMNSISVGAVLEAAEYQLGIFV